MPRRIRQSASSEDGVYLLYHGVQIMLGNLKHNSLLIGRAAERLLLRLDEDGRRLARYVALVSALRCHVYLPVNIGNALRIVADRPFNNLHDVGTVRLPKLKDEITLVIIEVQIVGEVVTKLVQRVVLGDYVPGAILRLFVQKLEKVYTRIK